MRTCSSCLSRRRGRGGAGRPSRDMSTLCFRSLSSFLLLFLFFILSSIECQTNPAEKSLQLPVSPHRMSLHQMSLLPSRLKYYLLCLSSSWFLKPTKFFKPTSCNFAVRIFSTMQRARESEGRRLAKKWWCQKEVLFLFLCKFCFARKLQFRRSWFISELRHLLRKGQFKIVSGPGWVVQWIFAHVLMPSVACNTIARCQSRF